jgi:hypothetical protein
MSTPQPIKNLATFSLLFLHAKCNGDANYELTKSGLAPVLSKRTMRISTWPIDADL